MTTLIAPDKLTPTHSVTMQPSPRGVLLSGIRWETYEALLTDLRDGPMRLTYDRGRLEIMAPAFNHERCKRQIGRLVETMAEVEDRPIISGGSTTFRLEDLERGLEPDECYYIAHEAEVRGRWTWILTSIPHPIWLWKSTAQAAR